jgi:alpha-glucosidase
MISLIPMTSSCVIVGTLFDPFFETSWFDYTHPQAADWYKNNLKLFMDSGVTGIWNDINEPANNFMPQAIYDFGGQNRKDIDARSLYALHEVALTQEAMLERRPNERPFILSRSGYAGSHRYNVNWSGDSLSTFDSLRVSVQMSVHMSLSGMILFGHDIGGFLGTPDPELFTRWMQFATFNPFMRNHAVNTSEFSEPWVYGAPYTGLVREAISQRYRWLPYLYSLVERSSRTAEPTLAPTFFHFLDDPRTQDQIMEFMLGEQMLIAPVYAQGAITRDLYLPAGSDWYEWKTDILFTGGQDITVDSPLESIPVFMRAGAIIPGGPVMQCVQVRVPCWDTTIAPNPPVYADIYAGPDRDFILYEDDGISYEFRDASAFKRTRISQVSVGNERQLQVAYVDDGGTLEPSARAWQLRVHQAADKPSNVSMNGAVLTEFNTLESLEAAERGWYFDPGTDKVVVQFWQGDLPVAVVVTKP